MLYFSSPLFSVIWRKQTVSGFTLFDSFRSYIAFLQIHSYITGLVSCKKRRKVMNLNVECDICVKCLDILDRILYTAQNLLRTCSVHFCFQNLIEIKIKRHGHHSYIYLIVVSWINFFLDVVVAMSKWVHFSFKTHHFPYVYAWRPYYTRVLQAPKTESFGNASGPVLVWMRGKRGFWKQCCRHLFTFWLGFISHDKSFPDLSCSNRMTLIWKKTNAISLDYQCRMQQE